MTARILMACMPKSGSTFLSNIIANLPDLSRAELVPDYGRREQELENSALVKAAAAGSYVAQCHVRCSHYTRLLVDRFRLTPVVLVRELPDIVWSLFRHVQNEGPISPAAYVPADLAAWPEEEALECITRLAMPWYFNFYMSWQEMPRAPIIKYGDVVHVPEIVTRTIATLSGAVCTDAEIEWAIEKAHEASAHRKSAVEDRRALPQSCLDQIPGWPPIFRAQTFPRSDCRSRVASAGQESVSAKTERQ